MELLKSFSCYGRGSLYYWHREAKSSNAEVDYIIQQQQTIVPIEVKSRKKGSMQSLFLFLKEKNIPMGVRFSLENYSVFDQIQVIPLYAVSDFMNRG